MLIGLSLALPQIPRKAGASGPPPWTPLDLGATLKYWVAADDHGTARWIDDGGGLISSITDRVGGLAATATTTARATWAANSFNGSYAGLTADKVANCYLLAAFASVLPVGATAGTIFAVASQTDTVSATNVLFKYGGVAASVDRILFRVSAGTSFCRGSDGTINLSDNATFDGAHIVSTSFAGTTISGRYDGRDFLPTASATIATLATGTVRGRIFATNAGAATSFWKGVLSDLIATTQLTVLEHQKLEGYFAWNKGLVTNLPAGHPYKTAAPQVGGAL